LPLNRSFAVRHWTQINTLKLLNSSLHLDPL
jgi:hypothetical protein